MLHRMLGRTPSATSPQANAMVAMAGQKYLDIATEAQYR